jgi:hypothetical protein
MIQNDPLRGEDSDRDGPDDRGAWKRRLFSDRDWSDVRHELVFSPHFHAVVVAPHIPGGRLTELVEDVTGWVIHRITKEDSNVSIGNDFDMARALTYCLSHVGIDQADDQETNQAETRWYLGDRQDHRPAGEDYRTVTADEDAEDRMDRITRAVSPLTLGIAYSDVACVQEYVDDQDDQDGVVEDFRVDGVDVDRGAASGRLFSTVPTAATTEDVDDDDDHDHGDGVDEVLDGDSDDVNNDSVQDDLDGDPDDVNDDSVQDDLDGDPVETTSDALDLEDDEEPEQCNGRLLHIFKAPEYLNDEDWVEQARHADQLREQYDAYDSGEWDPPG